MATAPENALAPLIRDLVTRDGISDSPVPGVKLMRARAYVPRCPVIYEPGIVIIAQGRKVGHLGETVIEYDAMNYLVLSVPMPFECETFASEEEHLLGLRVGVDASVLGELLIEMDDGQQADVSATPLGMNATRMTPELADASERLLRCMGSGLESRVLAPSIVREIIYRVLCGPQGGALRAVAARHSHLSQISRALKRIHSEFDGPLDVGTLAREASMSVSSFHHNFKAVTSTSPLQYVKSIRLHRARLLMAQDGMNASTAASSVGYESPSQFSREFKRFFGTSPVEEAAKVRAMLA